LKVHPGPHLIRWPPRPRRASRRKIQLVTPKPTTPPTIPAARTCSTSIHVSMLHAPFSLLLYRFVYAAGVRRPNPRPVTPSSSSPGSQRLFHRDHPPAAVPAIPDAHDPLAPPAGVVHPQVPAATGRTLRPGNRTRRIRTGGRTRFFTSHIIVHCELLTFPRFRRWMSDHRTRRTVARTGAVPANAAPQ